MHRWFTFVCVFQPHMCSCCEARRGGKSDLLELESIDNCELSWRWWKSNQSHLQRQPVHSTAEPSTQIQGFFLFFFLSYNSKQWRKGLLNYHEIQFLPKLVPLLFPGTCSQPWDYFSDIWGPFCCRHSQLTFPHLWTKSLWWQSSLSHSSVQCLLPMWDPKGSRTSTYLLNHLMLWRVSVHMSTGYTRPSTLATIWIISFSDRTVAKLMKSP